MCLRLHATDRETPKRDAVRRVMDRLAAGEGVVLSVGLSRPFQKSGDAVPKHWLQVNNIHLESEPLWRDSDRLAASAADGRFGRQEDYNWL